MITIEDALEEFLAILPQRLSDDEFYDWCDETDIRASDYEAIQDEDLAVFAAQKCNAFDKYIRNAKTEKRLAAVCAQKKNIYYFLLWVLETADRELPKTKHITIKLSSEFALKEKKALAELKKSAFVLKKVEISEKDEEALFKWIDEKCVADSLPMWEPTLNEIANFIEPAYAELVEQRRNATASSVIDAICAKQKELLLFLLWVQEAVEMTPDVSSYISKFIRERTVELY